MEEEAELTARFAPAAAAVVKFRYYFKTHGTGYLRGCAAADYRLQTCRAMIARRAVNHQLRSRSISCCVRPVILISFLHPESESYSASAINVIWVYNKTSTVDVNCI